MYHIMIVVFSLILDEKFLQKIEREFVKEERRYIET